MEFLEALDQGAHPWFQLLRRPWLDSIVVHLTDLGGVRALSAVVIVGVGLLVVQRRLRSAAILAGVALTAMLLDGTIKALVLRPRPEVVRPLLPIPASGSFPSGHALKATAVYVAAALLLTAGCTSWRLRTGVLAAALLAAFLVGLTRLYLGVHYMTDVLGGWTAGLALALLGRWLDDWWRLRAGQSVR